MNDPETTLSGLDCAPEIRELIDYWRSIHPQSGLPGRRHFDPIDLPELLAQIWLIDVARAPLRFRFRLVGTALVEFTGRDSTGKWLDEVYPEFAESGLSQRLRRCVETAEPQFRRHSIATQARSSQIEAEQIYLPLAADGASVDMILAMTVFLDGSAADGRAAQPPQGAGPNLLLD